MSAGSRSGGATSGSWPGGFAPPPYPYDRLAELAAQAGRAMAGCRWSRRLFDRDAVRPATPAVLEAMAASGARSGATRRRRDRRATDERQPNGSCAGSG